MSRFWILAVLLLAAIGDLPARAADFVVIVHPQVGVDHLSLAELQRIYRKEKTEWPGGGAIIPFDYAGTSELRRSFCRDVLGATVSEVQNFWINKRMTAGITGPKAFKSATLVKRFVANTPGGIGYIAPEQVDDTVKVVAIDGLEMHQPKATERRAAVRGGAMVAMIDGRRSDGDLVGRLSWTEEALRRRAGGLALLRNRRRLPIEGVAHRVGQLTDAVRLGDER